jgi:V8-like Glu-specific endopeptidase
MPSRFVRFIQHPLGSKVALGLLVVLSLAYVQAARNLLHSTAFAPAVTISTHQMESSPTVELGHWTPTNMRTAIDADILFSDASDFATGATGAAGRGAQQQGQAPENSSLDYPRSTVGKIFFSDSSGLDYVCSGTAVTGRNGSLVDTAGHCLYWQRNWTRNVVFCPLYDHGTTPFGCWAARALEVPSDWIDARANDLHHDFGMAVVAPNGEGTLTAVVGGAGWAYNQAPEQTFQAYGYPAARPFDGQSLQSCGPTAGKSWQHGGGTVVSIPCNMTGGSSGGPWFVQLDGNWYLNGHNDFTSSLQYGHMFSPYYDDTWYAMYEQALQA